MKIIDAHLHLFDENRPHGQAMAQKVGHENSQAHLATIYQELNILQGVVMSNQFLEPEKHCYDPALFHYCIGLDSYVTKKGIPKNAVELVEENLKRELCCGIKLYPGYQKVWLTDPMFAPFFQLAQDYGKPVAIHTGLTAHPRAHLKYSHPLIVDELAADHPKVQFVMCHFGNPFLQDAVAVLEKNPNVSTDLSGLLEGRVCLESYFQERGGYAKMLTDWLCYLGCWDRILFGTDFPIVNYGEYIQYICRLIPDQHWDKVFFHNANRVYQLGLS